MPAPSWRLELHMVLPRRLPLAPRRCERGALPGIAQHHKNRADIILPKGMGTKYEHPLVDGVY
jgi:hypothetical protein